MGWWLLGEVDGAKDLLEQLLSNPYIHAISIIPLPLCGIPLCGRRGEGGPLHLLVTFSSHSNVLSSFIAPFFPRISLLPGFLPSLILS
jgi:hypothetical protein